MRSKSGDFDNGSLNKSKDEQRYDKRNLHEKLIFRSILPRENIKFMNIVVLMMRHL